MNGWIVRGPRYELDGPCWQAKVWPRRTESNRIEWRFVVRRMPGAILLHEGHAQEMITAMAEAERLARGEAHG